MMEDVEIRLHDGPGAAGVAGAVTALYGRAWADRVSLDEFYRADRFAERFARYVEMPGFTLALAIRRDGAAGMMFGAPLAPDTPWWNNFRGDVEAGFTREDGRRTFAVLDLSVDPGHRRRGVARRLHDTLVGSRPARRAVLLVRPDNEAARRAYAGWGWTGTGTARPAPHRPDYVVMVRPLPL
jgi:ribosomal protein S18 acetylase RimI-like enzyme